MTLSKKTKLAILSLDKKLRYRLFSWRILTDHRLHIWSYANMVLRKEFNDRKHPPEVLFKIDVLKKLSSFTEKHLCWSLFLIYFLLYFLLFKRDSNTGAFLWNLRNLQEHLLLQNTYRGYIWMINSPLKGRSITYKYFAIKAW